MQFLQRFNRPAFLDRRTQRIFWSMLPLIVAIPLNPAVSQAMPSPPLNAPPASTVIESYTFTYNYANPPELSNRVPQTYTGEGVTLAATYKPGETILVKNKTGAIVGKYTILSVNDTVPFNLLQLDLVSINQYTVGSQQFSNANGRLSTESGGSSGLGSESGSLLRTKVGSSSIVFNNQAISALPSSVSTTRSSTLSAK